jgi:CHAT domain-containing protein
LEWLWDAIVEPVLSRLGYSKRADNDSNLPNVWWCSTGLLSFLPIHAAGYYNGSSSQSAMDCVISAYTSSLRALKYSRDNISPSEQNSGLIAIMPTTRNYAKLPRARDEAAKVKKVTRPQFKLDLIKTQPSQEELRIALVGKIFAHFVCHARSDESDPSSSALILKDGPMTVAEISQMSIRGGALAYLSACHTALSRAPKLEDEVITLTSAFQVAGFARVVGTLWNAEDSIGCKVAEKFYENLAGDVERSAVALHRAVLGQRTQTPDNPSLWASYIYTGA